MAAIAPPQITGGGSLPNIGVPYSEVGPTSVPDFTTLLNYLLQSGSQAGQNVPQLQDLLQQEANSPLMQAVLGPALQNLIPGQKLARQNLSDQFIQAGMTGSGAQGVASSQLEGALGQQQNSLISQIISSLLPTMVSGMNQQYANQFKLPELIAQALGISRPSTVTGSQAGLQQSVGGGQNPSMANNPFFTPDAFASSSSGAGAGGGGGMGSPGVGNYAPGNAVTQTYPGNTQSYGGMNAGQPSYTDWMKYLGYDPLSANTSYAGTSNIPTQGGSGLLDMAMQNPYGSNNSFMTNQYGGFGDTQLQPQDYMMGAFGQPQAPDISYWDFSM